ncbi:3-oxoacyl-[acyl-carrier-protein] reductase FabG-like [Oppia nitens]|uniref:3-oxoacyl-[acyl-carrier-protein] reductase FabG-like n=1 Tax=Oppia nitens TaxID=1686743 RepID=UPI0023DA4E3F|nr:3-oxoacyl-[acyl-carrier-protein] reductase FabG-like [Oppia nitens]
MNLLFIIINLFPLFLAIANANILFNLDNANKQYNQLDDPRNFTGKVVLTTGSSSGIGAGIAKLFAQLGANVVITGRNQTEIQLVANECQQLSPKKLKPLQVKADVSNSTELQSLLDQTIKTYGQLDVLVNNAGMGAGAAVTDKQFMPVFDKLMAVNLRPYVELSHLSVPYLNKTNGTIISISSVSAIAPTKGVLAYSVSKAAIDMMGRVLALELGPNIRVNTINPGYIDTPFHQGDRKIIDELMKYISSKTPMKRIGRPEDVADACVWLASRSASFITGANLVVDGGIVYNIGGLF